MPEDRSVETCVRARLSLLQGFELEHDQAPVLLPLTAQRLVAFLALHRRRLLRVYVAGVLWIDSSQESANASLRTTLWRLRQPFPLVDASASHLALNQEVSVDLHRVSALSHAVVSGGGDDASDLAELIDAGDLLPDWYDDWVVIERERFRQRRLHALEALCERLAGQGRYGEAVEAGLTAVAGEPLRESTHRAVMRAHLAEGNRHEALRQYGMLRALLCDQLGLEPTAETELLRQRCERRAAPPPTHARFSPLTDSVRTP